MKRFALLLVLAAAIACNDEKSGDWKAVLNLMPPQKHLTVTGSMMYGDPSGNPTLQKKVPQGINPKILMLEVVPPTDAKGNKKVDLKYEEDFQTEDQHTSVEVFYKNERIADIKIEKVH